MRRSLLAVPGIERTSDAFRRALVQMADEEGLHADHLAAVMSYETGGEFRADTRNPLSGAVGLIQFTTGAASRVGTTQEQLAQMTPVEQLEYVARYYRTHGGERARTLEDHYLVVFAPSAVGRAPSHAIYSAPSLAYEQNAPMDVNGDGVIDVYEATVPVRVRRQMGLARGRVSFAVPARTPAITSSSASADWIGLALLGFGIYRLGRYGRGI